MISESCSVHNDRPCPDPDCPIVGTHRNGAIDSEQPAPVQKRTREEAAEMVLRSMVADMRRQGWTLSDNQANEMVAHIRAEILGTQTGESHD